LGSWGVCLGKAANGAGLLRAQLRVMGSEQKVLHLPHVAHAARVPKRAAVIQQMDTETVGLQAPLGMEHGRGAIELVQRVGRSHGSEPHPGQNPGKTARLARARACTARATTPYPGTHARATTKKQNYQQQQKQPKCESVAAATATAAVAAAAANSNNSGAGSSNKSNRLRAGSESSSNSCKTKRKQLQQQQKR
jgi:hypothetical protein